MRKDKVMTGLRTGTALAIALAAGLMLGTTAVQASGSHEGEQLYPVLTYRHRSLCALWHSVPWRTARLYPLRE